MKRAGWRAPDALGVALALALAAPALAYPFFRDQASFAYIGWGWLDGYWPYADSFDNKPPGIFALYALSGLLIQAEWGARALDLSAAIATGVTAALLLQRAGRPPSIGAGVLLACALHFTGFDYARSAQVEIWEGLFLALSLLACLRWRRLGLAGALAGVAFVFKLPAAFPAVGIAMFAAVMTPAEVSWRYAGAVLARYGAGALVVIAAACLPFVLAGHGARLWEAVIGFNLGYSASPTNTNAPYGFFLMKGRALSGVTALLLLLGSLRPHRAGALGWLGFVGALWLSVAVQGRYWHYHWGVLLPGLTAAGLWGIQRVSARPAARLGLAVGAAALLLVFARNWSHLQTWDYPRYMAHAAGYAAGHIDRDGFLTPFRDGKDLSYRRVRRIAAVIEANAGPGDTLCVRWVEPGVYTLTGLRCPSRFASEFHLRHPTATYQRRAWVAEHRAAQLAAPPTFVVTAGEDRRDLDRLRGRGYRHLERVSDQVVLTLTAGPAVSPAR